MEGDNCKGLPPSKRMKLYVPSSDEAFPQEKVYPDKIDMDEALSNGDLGSKGQIKRVEFVRIIAQALYSLGYEKSAALLEREAAIPSQSATASQFRKEILEALWDKSIKTLHRICPMDSGTMNKAAFLILEQKFMEQLHRGEAGMALKTLRSEISRLRIRTQRLRELANCVLFPTQKYFLEKVAWRGIGAEANMTLLLEIQALLSPEIMISEKRLEGLIEQALSEQRKSCVFHNADDKTLTLYTDHHCGRDQIPTQTLQVLDAHENEVWFLQFSHKGKYLASASKDFTAIIWEIGDNDVVVLKLTLTGHQKPVSFLAWSPDDTMLLTCGSEEVVRLWDVRTGVCLHTYTKPNIGFTSCAWFPDGKRFVSGGDKCIYTWDSNGNCLHSWDALHLPCINNLAITFDGIHLVGIYGDKRIMIYNLEKDSVHTIKEEDPITSLSVSKDGRYLIANLFSQEIHLWDMTTNKKCLPKFKGHRQERYVIKSCFGGSDHGFIISGSEDSQVYIWHRSNAELLEVLPGHAGTVNCVSWNPMNPLMFASASDDHNVRIWGLSTKAQRYRSTGTKNGSFPFVNGVIKRFPF